ncbi:hypothetical protein [Isobaculum melis]|uniref:SRPBCC family protein n=1 Tax=Isobaculum melis TaxID=142588 RepID=A0A1H9T2P3_9LACT|nr:hypothetical protein [Isobaculum melis]SER91411.1 hypothetical protein SAMN04488559_11082 [Isobaculum melis]
MRTYTHEKIIPVQAKYAWQALTQMNLWLPKLQTVTTISYDETSPFFQVGKMYDVHTPEGISMKSQLKMIDSEHMKVAIGANFFLLNSRLSCSVSQIDDKRCEISRIQMYPGLIGSIFTSLFNKREASETEEYLAVWEDYALRLFQNEL